MNEFESIAKNSAQLDGADGGMNRAFSQDFRSEHGPITTNKKNNTAKKLISPL